MQSRPPLCRGESAPLRLWVTGGPLLSTVLFLVSFAAFVICSQLYSYWHLEGFHLLVNFVFCLYNFRTSLPLFSQLTVLEDAKARGESGKLLLAISPTSLVSLSRPPRPEGPPGRAQL